MGSEPQRRSLEALPLELMAMILAGGPLNLEDVGHLLGVSKTLGGTLAKDGSRIGGLVTAAMSKNVYALIASRSLPREKGKLPTTQWFDKFAQAYNQKLGIEPNGIGALPGRMSDPDETLFPAPDGSLRAVSPHEYFLTQMIEAAMQWSQTLNASFFPFGPPPSPEARMDAIEVINRVLDRLPDWIARLPVDAIAPLAVSARKLTIEAADSAGLRQKGGVPLQGQMFQHEIYVARRSRLKTLQGTAVQALHAREKTFQVRLELSTIKLHFAASTPQGQANAIGGILKQFRCADEAEKFKWLSTLSNAVPQLYIYNYQGLFSIYNKMVSLMKSSALKSAPPRLFDRLSQVRDCSLDDTALSALTDLLSKLPEDAPASAHLAQEVPRLLATKCEQIGGAAAEGLLELSLDRTPESAPTGPDAGARLEQQLAGLAHFLVKVDREQVLFSKGVQRFLSLARRSTSLDAATHAADLARKINYHVVDPVLTTGALEAIERYAHQLRPGEQVRFAVWRLGNLTQPQLISSMDATTKLKARTVIRDILKRRLHANRGEAGWEELRSNLESLSGDKPALG